MTEKLSSLCTEFTDCLASTAPVPGGGGAAALCGALAAALVSMAGGLSVGKKSTAENTQELTSLTNEAKQQAQRLLQLIDADAAAFEPLSRAYSIPKDVPDRAEILSQASLTAAEAPMAILQGCLSVAENLERMAKICSRLMLSDVGCAASLCSAAADCAAMNIYVNLPGISDMNKAHELRERADDVLYRCNGMCAAVSGSVMEKLKG